MTVKETVYAQSITEKPIRGMLTGPITILNWSFVREDIPRFKVANQIAHQIYKHFEFNSHISMYNKDCLILGLKEF